MKIHYISCHEILEYDEVQLLTDMGHEVFSNGAYINPEGHISLARPGIKGMDYNEKYAKLAIENPKTNLPKELIDPFDVIIVMHQPDVLIQNWDKMKHKKVVWRTIGQSVPSVEEKLAPLREEGLLIVRYSPKEENIDNYIGSDALIRFYKDEKIYSGWDGATGDVVNFTQSLLGRRDFVHYDEIMPVIEVFSGKIYGPGNEDLGSFNGGKAPFDKQLEIMRHAGVMVYGGTWPASYTLSFIEALMMGLPMVVISKTLANVPKFQNIDFYEVDEIMSKISAPVCGSVNELLDATKELLDNTDYARDISRRQIDIARELFGKDVIAKQWRTFLNSI